MKYLRTMQSGAALIEVIKSTVISVAFICTHGPVPKPLDDHDNDDVEGMMNVAELVVTAAFGLIKCPSACRGAKSDA